MAICENCPLIEVCKSSDRFGYDLALEAMKPTNLAENPNHYSQEEIVKAELISGALADISLRSSDTSKIASEELSRGTCTGPLAINATESVVKKITLQRKQEKSPARNDVCMNSNVRSASAKIIRECAVIPYNLSNVTGPVEIT